MSDRESGIGIYAFGPFRLDPLSRVLTREGVELPLTPTMTDLLFCLLERPGAIVTKDELFEAVWPKRIVEEANIRQTIFTLRKALAPEGDRLIATAPGRGYRFVGAVTSLGPATLPAPIPLVHDRPGWTRARYFRGGVALAAVLMLLAGVGAWRWRATANRPTDGKVALADFDNRTGNPAFSSTMNDRLRLDLTQSPALQLLTDKQQHDVAVAVGKPRDDAITLPLASAVCAATKASAVVHGTITRADAGFALSLAASRCDGVALATETADAAGADEVASAVDRLAARMREDLGESAESVARFGVPAGTTPSLAALKAYSQANWLMAHGRTSDAVPLDRAAIELDPDFAQAYAHLGIAYETMYDKAQGAAAIGQAYRLRNTLPERERLRIIALHNQFVTRNLDDMLADLRTWTQAYPRDAVAWSNLANAETFYGFLEEGAADARRAIALAPPLEAPYLVFARAEMGLGNLALARRGLALAARRGVAGVAAQRELLRIAIAAQDLPAIERDEANGATDPKAILLGFVEAEYLLSQGRVRRASALYDRLIQFCSGSGQPNILLPDWTRALADAHEDNAARALLAHASGEPDYNQLAAEAAVGNAAAARNDLDRQEAGSPRDTFLVRIAGPQVVAALAIRQGKPAEAVSALRPALPFARRNLEIPFLLASALLADGHPTRAEAVFRLILAHRGWYPETVLYPLAELGLARSLAREGSVGEATAAYAKLIGEWASADADFPPLVTAKQELGRLKVSRRVAYAMPETKVGLR